jgi:hypothetical protein
MAGTRTGGLQAVETNKRKYGEDFYAKIGSMGGKVGTTGGFHADRNKARTAGSLGGRRGKKGFKFLFEKDGVLHYTKNDTGETVTFKS